MTQPLRVPAMLGGESLKKSEHIKPEHKELHKAPSKTASSAGGSGVNVELPPQARPVGEHRSSSSAIPLNSSCTQWDKSNAVAPSPHVCSIFVADMDRLCGGLPVLYRYSAHGILPAYLLSISPRTRQAVVRVPSAYNAELLELFVTVPTSALMLVPHFRQGGLVGTLGTLAYSAYLKETKLPRDLLQSSVAADSGMAARIVEETESAAKTICQTLQTAETNLVQKLVVPPRCNQAFLGALTPTELSHMGIRQPGYDVADDEPTEASGILDTEYSDVVSEVSASLSGGAKNHARKPLVICIGDLYFSRYNPLFHHKAYTCLSDLVDRELRRLRFPDGSDLVGLKKRLLKNLSEEYLLSLTAVKNALDMSTTKNAFVCDTLLLQSGLSLFATCAQDNLVDIGDLYQRVSCNCDALLKHLEDDYDRAINKSNSRERFRTCYAALTSSTKFEKQFQRILNKYLAVLLPKIHLFVLSLGSIGDTDLHTLIDALICIFQFLETNSLQTHPFYNIVPFLDSLREEVVDLVVLFSDCLVPSTYVDFIHFVLGSNLYNLICTTKDLSSNSRIASAIASLIKEEQLPTYKTELIVRLKKAVVSSRNRQKRGVKLRKAQFYTHLNKFLVERLLSSVACIMCEEYVRTMRANEAQQSTLRCPEDIIKVYMLFVRILANICADEYADAALKWQTDMLEYMDVMSGRAVSDQRPLAHPDGLVKSSLLERLETLGLFPVDEEQDTLANVLQIELDFVADINQSKTDITGLYTNPPPEAIIDSLRELFFCALDSSNYLYIIIKEFFKTYVARGIIPRDDLVFLSADVGSTKVLEEYRALEAQILAPLRSAPLDKIISSTLTKVQQEAQAKKTPFISAPGWKGAHGANMVSVSQQRPRSTNDVDLAKEIFSAYSGLISETDMLEYTRLSKTDSQLIAGLLARRKALLAEWVETIFQYQLDHENQSYQKVALTNDDIYGCKPFLDMCSECDHKISVSPASEPTKGLFGDLFDSLIGVIRLACDILIDEVGLKELRKLADKTVLQQTCPILEAPQPISLPPQIIFNLDIGGYNLLFLSRDDVAAIDVSKTQGVSLKTEIQDSSEDALVVYSVEGVESTTDPSADSLQPRLLTFNDVEILLHQKPSVLMKLVHNATILTSKIDNFLLNHIISLPSLIGNKVIRFNNLQFKAAVIKAMCTLRRTVADHTHLIVRTVTSHLFRIVVLTESIMGKEPKSPDDLALMINGLECYDNFVKSWIPTGLVLVDLLMEMRLLESGYLDFLSVQVAKPAPDASCVWGSFSALYSSESSAPVQNNTLEDGSGTDVQSIRADCNPHTEQVCTNTPDNVPNDVLPPLSADLLSCFAAVDPSAPASDATNDSEFAVTLDYFNNAPHRSFNVHALLVKIFKITGLQKIARHIIKSHTRTFARHLLKLSDWVSDTTVLLHEYCKEVLRMSYRDIFIARFYPRQFKQSFFFLTKDLNISFLDDNFEVLEDELVMEFLESIQAYVKGFQLLRSPVERSRLRMTQPLTRATIRTAAIQDSLHSGPHSRRFMAQYFRPAEAMLIRNVTSSDESTLDINDAELFKLTFNQEGGPSSSSANELAQALTESTCDTRPLSASSAPLKIADLRTACDTEENATSLAECPNLFYNVFEIFNELLYISDVLHQIHQVALRWADCLGVTLNLADNPNEIVSIIHPASVLITSLYSIKQRYLHLQTILLKDTNVQDFMTLLSEAAQAIVIGKQNPSFRLWADTIQAAEADLLTLGPKVFYLHCLSSPTLMAADFKQLAEELSLPLTEDKLIPNAQLLDISDFDYALRLARMIFTRAEKSTQTLLQLAEIDTFLQNLQIFPCELVIHINLSNELGVLFNKWQNSDSMATLEEDQQNQDLDEPQTAPIQLSAVPPRGTSRRGSKLSLALSAQPNNEPDDKNKQNASSSSSNAPKGPKARAFSRLSSLKLNVDELSTAEETPETSGIIISHWSSGSKENLLASTSGAPTSTAGSMTPNSMLSHASKTVLPFIQVHSGLLKVIREALFFVADILSRKHPHTVQARARQLEVQLLLLRSALISISRVSMLLPELLYILPRLTIVRNGVQDMSFLSLYNDFGDYKRTIFNTLNVLREANKLSSVNPGPGSFLALITGKPQLFTQLAHCTHDLSSILENVYTHVLSIPMIPHYNGKPVACALLLPKIPSIFYSIFSLQENLNTLYYCPAVYQSVLPNFDRVLLGNPRNMSYCEVGFNKKSSMHALPHLSPSDIIIVGLESGFERLYFEYGLRAPQELFLLSGMLNDMRLHREGLLREHKRAVLLLISLRISELLCQCLYQSIIYALTVVFCLHLDGNVDHFFTLKFTIFEQLKRHLVSPELHDSLEQKVDYTLLSSDYKIPETYINTIRRELFGLTGPMSNDDELLAKSVEKVAKIQYYKQRRCQRYLCFKAIAARVFEYDQLLNLIIHQTIEYYNDHYADAEIAALKGSRKKAKSIRIEAISQPDFAKALSMETISKLREIFVQIHHSKIHRSILTSAGCSLNVETNKILSSLAYGFISSSVLRDDTTDAFIKPSQMSSAPPTRVMMTAEDATLRCATRGFGKAAVNIVNSAASASRARDSEEKVSVDSHRTTGSITFTQDCKLFVGSSMVNLGPHYLGKATILDSLPLNYKQLAVVAKIIVGFVQRKPIFIYSDKLRGYNLLDTKIIAQYTSRLLCTRHIFLSLTSYSPANLIILQIISYFMAGYGVYLHGLEFLSTEHHARLIDCFNTIYLARGSFPIVKYQSGGSVPGELALNDFSTCMFTGYIVIILPELIYHEDGSISLSTTGRNMNSLFNQAKIEAFLDSFGSSLATSATKLNTLLTGALCNLSVSLPTGSRQPPGTRLTNERGDLPEGKPRCKIMAQLYGAILTDFLGIVHFDPTLVRTTFKCLPNAEVLMPIPSNHVLYHLFKKKGEAHAESFYEISLLLNAMQSACPKLYPDDIDIIYKRARDTTNTFSVAITTALLLIGQVYSLSIRDFLIKVVAFAFRLTSAQVSHIHKIVASLNKLLNLSTEEPVLKKALARDIPASRSHVYDTSADHSTAQKQDKQHDSEQEDNQLTNVQAEADTFKINYTRSPTASLSQNIWACIKQTLSSQYVQFCEAASEQVNIIGPLGTDLLLVCLEFLQLGPCALFSNNQSVQVLECYATILSKFGRLQPFFVHSINDLHHHSDTIRRLGSSALVVLLINDTTGNLGPSLYGALLAFMNPVPHLSMTNGVELDCELSAMFNASHTGDSLVSKYGRPKVLVITTGSFLEDKMLATPMGLIPHRIVIDSSVMRTEALIKLLVLNSFKLSSATANHMLDYIHEKMTQCTIDNIENLDTAKEYFRKMCTPPCTDEASALQMGLRRLRFISSLFYILVLHYFDQATAVFSMAPDLRGWRILRSTFYYYLVCCKVCVFKPPDVRSFTAEQLAERLVATNQQLTRKPQHQSSITTQSKPPALQSPSSKGLGGISSRRGDAGTVASCNTNRTARLTNLINPSLSSLSTRHDLTIIPRTPSMKSPTTQTDPSKTPKGTNMDLMNSLKPEAELQFSAHTTINLSHVWCAEHIGSFSSALAMFGERRFTFFDISLSDEFLIEYVYRAESYEQACFNLLCPVFAAVWTSVSLAYVQYIRGKVHRLSKLWMKYLSFHSKHTIPLLLSRFSNDKLLQKSLEVCLTHIEETLPPEYPYEQHKYAYLAVVTEKGSYMQYTSANRAHGNMPNKRSTNPILKSAKHKRDGNASAGAVVPPLTTGPLAKQSSRTSSAIKEQTNHYTYLKFLPYKFGQSLMTSSQTDNYLKPTSVHKLALHFDMLRSQLIFFIAICILGGVSVHLLGPRYSGKTTLIQAAHALIHEYSVMQLYLPSSCEENKIFLADAARELYLTNGNELRFPGRQILHMHFTVLFLDNGKFEQAQESVLDELTKHAGLDIVALFLGERVLSLNSPGNISISPEGDSHQSLLGTVDAPTLSITFESEFYPPQLQCSQLINIVVPDTGRAFLIDLLLNQRRYLDISSILTRVYPGLNCQEEASANETTKIAPGFNLTTDQAITSLNELSATWIKQLIDGLLLVKDQIPVSLLRLLAEMKRLSIFSTDQVQDIQMRLFTASSVFLALRFISEITAPTIINIIDALRGSLAMGKLSPIGPWGILTSSDTAAFAKANKLLELCGVTKLQMELSWETETLRIARENSQILEDSEASDSDTVIDGTCDTSEASNDQSLSEVAGSYSSFKPHLRQPPAILRVDGPKPEKQSQKTATDPSLTKFEESCVVPSLCVQMRGYIEMRKKLKILLGLKAFRGVKISSQTSLGLRQSSSEVFKAYIHAFTKYVVTRCSPGLANRIFTVHLTIQYDLELREKSVLMMLQSLRNPHGFRKQHGDSALEYFSRLQLDIITTILRKQDISSSLLDIVLMLASFGGYKLYGGRALIKLLLRVPSSGMEYTLGPATLDTQVYKESTASTGAKEVNDDSTRAAIAAALGSVKKDAASKDRTQSSSSTLITKTKLAQHLDIKVRDSLEIERQLEKYSAFDIDDTTQTQSADESLDRKTYKIILSVDVFLTQQNLDLSDDVVQAAKNSSSGLSISTEKLTPSQVPSSIFDEFIKSLISNVGRRGESQMVYYLLRGVFLLALQINPILALKSITFMEALQFCKVNNGVNPDIISSNILDAHLREFFAIYNISSLEHVWIEPTYSFFVVSSLAHLQHVDSLKVIHGLSSLGHAGNISLRLFTPAELVTLCLLASERHKLGVVIDTSTLISIASRNLAILLIADMPTPIGMKLPESPVLRHFATDISAISMQSGTEDTAAAHGSSSMSRAVSFSIANTSLVRKSVLSSIPLLLLSENQRYFSLNRNYFTLAAGYKQDIAGLDAQGKRYRGVRYIHILATTEAVAAATLHVYLFVTANLLPDSIFLTFERFAELSKLLYEQRVRYYTAFLHSCDILLQTIKLLNTGIYCQMFSPTIRENIIAYKDNLTLLKNYLYPYYKRALVLLRNAPCDCPAAVARVYAGSLRKDAIASDEAFETALSQHLKTTGFDRLSIIHNAGTGGFADTLFGSSKAGLDVITDTYLRDIIDTITCMFDDCDVPFAEAHQSSEVFKANAPPPGKNYSEILMARNSTLPFNLTAFPSAFLGICLDSFYPQWDVGAACYLTRFIFFANATVLQEILSLILAISLGTRLCFIEKALALPLAIASELHFITTTPQEYEERKEELAACRGNDGRYTLESLVGIIYWINAAQNVATFNLELAKAFSQDKAIGFTNVLFENITQINVHQTNAHESEISVLNMRTLMALFKLVGSRVSDKKSPIKLNGISITPVRPLHEYRYYIGLSQGTKFSSIVASGIMSFEVINSSILIQPKYSNINLYLKYLELQTPSALELQVVQTYSFTEAHLQNVLLYLTTPLEKTRPMMGHRLLFSTADLMRLLKRSSEINSKFVIEKHGTHLKKAIMNPGTFVHLLDENEDDVSSGQRLGKQRRNCLNHDTCDEMTFLLTTPVSYFDLELAMRLCERSIALANFRLQLEHEATELASKAEFAKHCARGMVSILIICQKLSCVMPTLARIFTDHFFAHFFLYLDEQLETPQWKGVPLSHVISHILLPYINARVYRMVPKAWGMPVCDLMSLIFSCALSECSIDNLFLLRFILSSDLREKAIRVSPFYNIHDERCQRARDLMDTAPFSFQASIATNYTWRNISLLYPHSERVLSWLDYFTSNNFMFVSLVTSLDPYKMILGHYIFKESQKAHASTTDKTGNVSEQSYITPLFTEECENIYHSNAELPLPTDLQVPCYNNVLQSLVFSLSITQLHLSQNFKLFGTANRLCSFRNEIQHRDTILKEAHEAYCKNQNLIPELTYPAVIGIVWYIIMVCGYIPDIATIGKSSHTYDPAHCIKPMLTTDTRYERKMSSRSYADGIGSCTLVIFYEEGMSILDLVIDRLERSLFDELKLAPCVITSRPTEDDFRTKTVIVDASIDTKETIDRLITMYNKGWRAASLLIVLIPVHVGQFYAEEAISRKEQRSRLLENEADTHHMAASNPQVQYNSLSYSLGVFMSISNGSRYYIEGPKTLSDAVVYLVTISLCVFKKHDLDLSSLNSKSFALYCSLLLQNALLKSDRGRMYSDSRFLTSLLHLIGMKKAEGMLSLSSQLISEYILAARSQDEASISAKKAGNVSPALDIHQSDREAHLSIYCNFFGPHPAISGPTVAFLSTYYSHNVPKMLFGMPCKWLADASSVHLILDGKFDQASLALTIARARLGRASVEADTSEIEDILLDIRNAQCDESSEALSSLSMSSVGSTSSALSTQNTHTSEGTSVLTRQALNDDATLLENRLEVTATELTKIVPRTRQIEKVSCDSKTASFLRLPNEEGALAIERILKTIKRYEHNIILKDSSQKERSPAEAERLTQLTASDLSSLEALKYQVFNMVPITYDNSLCNRMYREIFTIGLSQEVMTYLDGHPVYKNMFADTTIQQEEADLLKSIRTILYLSDGYCQTRRTTLPYFRTSLTERAPVFKIYSDMYWELRVDIYQSVLGNILKWAMLLHQSTGKGRDRERKTFVLLASRPTAIQQYKIDCQNNLVFSINVAKKKKLDKKAREKPSTDLFMIKLTGFRLFNIAYDPIEDTVADATPESVLGYTQSYTFYAVLVDTDYCEHNNSCLNRSDLKTALDMYKSGLVGTTTEMGDANKTGDALDAEDGIDDLIGIDGASYCSAEENEHATCFVSIPVIIEGTISGMQLFLRNKTGLQPLDVSIKGAYCSTGYLY